MKFLKSIFFGIIISGVLILNAANVYAALNNRNVWTGFFHQKGSPSSVSIKKSFSAAFKNYLDSGKPYFVFAYTLLQKPPYFNFDKKINLVRIKKPDKSPREVPIAPIITPCAIKIIIISLELAPIDFNMAISFLFSITTIMRVEIILNAATSTIRDRITNIVSFSNFIAENKFLLSSSQLKA